MKQFIVTSRDSIPMDNQYPNAYWKTLIPSTQNISNLILSYIRIDAQILNVNEHSNFFWVRYPDLPVNDQWQMITLDFATYDEAKDLAPTINYLLGLKKTEVGTTMDYSFEYSTTYERFIWHEPHTAQADREIDFQESNLGFMIGFPEQKIYFGTKDIYWAIISPDVWVNYKEIYLLCSSGHNDHFDLLWPQAANPDKVLAILPLEWRTKNDQTTQFIYTNQDLQFLTPPRFETPDSLDHLVFQLIYRDRYGFHLLPQYGISGNTLLVVLQQQKI